MGLGGWSTANTPDPNGRLDLESVRRISLGMNHAVDENVLEVSDLYVVAGGPSLQGLRITIGDLG